MRTAERPDGTLLLTYDDVRWSRLLVGIAALLAIAAVYELLRGTDNSDRLLGLFASAAMFLLAAIVFLEQAHVVVNPVTRTIEWRRRWGFQRRAGSVPFDQVGVVFAERPVADEGIPSRRIVLRTKSGDTIPLTKGYQVDANDDILRTAQRIEALAAGSAHRQLGPVESLVAAGRIIDAIKHVRETTGASLEEAKRQVDALKSTRH